MIPTAWHYTIGAKAELIRADGLILPATVNVPTGEVPVVWFSTHPFWEPTAMKRLRDVNTGEERPTTMREIVEMGAWRFGRPTAALVYWRKLIAAAHMSTRTVRALERTSGADPGHWWGSLEPVRVADCITEQLVDGRWRAL